MIAGISVVEMFWFFFKKTYGLPNVSLLAYKLVTFTKQCNSFGISK